MSRRTRKWLIGLSLTGIVVAVLALVASRAVKHVPTFYAEALRANPAADRESSHTMQRKITALAGDTMNVGAWHAVFTDQQINGYLAFDLPAKHPEVLPKQVHDPRVVVRSDGLYVGWRFEGRWQNTVYSICLVPYVVSPNVVGVRIRHIRAGALPVPLGEVVDGLTAAALDAGVRLQWRQENGDPVAMIELPSTEDESAKELVLESITLQDGAIALTGHTQPRTPSNGPRYRLNGVRIGDQAAENENRHR